MSQKQPEAADPRGNVGDQPSQPSKQLDSIASGGLSMSWPGRTKASAPAANKPGAEPAPLQPRAPRKQRAGG